MGVPGFFLWLIKKYKQSKFIFDKDCNLYDVSNIDALMIDANCMLHPSCFKILREYNHLKNTKQLQYKMLDEIINYLKHIIEFVDPKKLIYIAIDGVAPIAKIKQQRMRRFKSVKTNSLYNNIKRKHKKDVPFFWNNSAITPGTKFMDQITDTINKFIENNNYKCSIIFSSANEPAEGEHKLLQYIRNNNNNYTYSVYGLDADLIFLSLSANKNNITLVRESTTRENQLEFVSIDALKNSILQEIKDRIENNNINNIEYKLNDELIIKDFIFICYFLGNDFLPHIPSIDIKCYNKEVQNGLDLLLQAYTKVYTDLADNLLIMDNGVIKYNQLFLQSFLEYLSLFENNFFVNLYNSKKFYRKCQSDDPYDREMHNIDNLYFPIKNKINLGKDTPELWKYRYYKQYYFSETNQKEIIQYACFKYFEGLIWVANYYFNKCCSWEWYYPFDHAPFISDMAVFFKKYDMDKITFNLGKPLKPIEQLLNVLPPQSNYLLPDKYQYLMTHYKSPIIDLYPIDYQLDMLYKKKYWQCIPILPDLDIERVKKAVQSI